MRAADDAPADQLRHDLLTPLTALSARVQLLARDIRRSPSLAEEERVKMLASSTAIETAVQTMCVVISAIGDKDRAP